MMTGMPMGIISRWLVFLGRQASRPCQGRDDSQVPLVQACPPCATHTQSES